MTPQHFCCNYSDIYVHSVLKAPFVVVYFYLFISDFNLVLFV